MANKSFLAGRGGRKPITKTEKLIKAALESIKKKEAAAKEVR